MANLAAFIIFQTPEAGIGIPISLKGFRQGFDDCGNERPRQIYLLYGFWRGLTLARRRARPSRLMLTTWAQWNGSTPEIKLSLRRHHA